MELFLMNVTLELLDFLVVGLRSFALFVGLMAYFWQKSAPIYTKFIRGLEKLFKSKTPPAHLTLTTATEPEPPSPLVLYKPSFALQMLIYSTLVPQLARLPLEQRSVLRGRRFAALADSIIYNTPWPIIEELGLTLPPREEVEKLRGLPELIVTPPDDGDRMIMPGQKGAAKVRYTLGLLAPPKRRGRPGKLIRNRERELAAAERRKSVGSRET